ncbi:hypothetical protein GFB56_14675 [Ensifer sp. T173]|uniref:Secreted protein n=1 Tax=Ensifer canadensis TaxID=555315 RepID=A0AAW4FIY4_9HYPH|nr:MULTISPECIES: hypothetical protein [Ensifer]MBD9488590.1 hypothetical protein [Ensifer sp. ENS11]MBM3092054.1 hypothetical protein [Ensifer canadensis]UBI77321.1 hypothetical protein J3R84_09565 [Ensifer canadensis]
MAAASSSGQKSIRFICCIPAVSHAVAFVGTKKLLVFAFTVVFGCFEDTQACAFHITDRSLDNKRWGPLRRGSRTCREIALDICASMPNLRGNSVMELLDVPSTCHLQY